MSKTAKLSTSRVAVRPSRIRREAPPAPERKLAPPSREREILIGIIGVVLFALAISAITVGFSAITGKDDSAARPAAATAGSSAR